RHDGNLTAADLVTIESRRLFAGGGSGGMRGGDNRSRARDGRSGSGGGRGDGAAGGYWRRLLPWPRGHPRRCFAIGGVNFAARCRLPTTGALLPPRILGRFLG